MSSGSVKSDQKVRDRQEERTLPFQPTWWSLSFWHAGTMPVLAGMIAVLQLSARCALGDMPARALTSGTVQWLPWLPGGWVACGRRIVAR